MRSVVQTLLFLFVAGYLVSVHEAVAAACPPPFSKLIQHGGYGVSDTKGELISGCNLDTPYVPASILKIPTALAAFAILGPEYRFTTRFYTDKQENLYIMGFGDPLLISEEIRIIFVTLKKLGVRRINSIFIDTSNFTLEYQVPGSEFSDNPYDAPVGPVAVNFNSIPVLVTKDCQMFSNEENTPNLPIMQELAMDYRPGRYRLNVGKGNCNPDQRMARYTAELFRALQQEAEIPGQGKIGLHHVPKGAKLVYEHYSTKNLTDLTASFLKYSSNFIANLVYLTCGAKKFGYPATWDKAERAVHQELVKQLGSTTASAILHKEGAGLYRGNRVTIRAMLEVLKVFRPYAYLLRKHSGVPTKSGSMKGVWNYVGYLTNGNPYVIILNQLHNRRHALLDLLQDKFSIKKTILKKTSKHSGKRKKRKRR